MSQVFREFLKKVGSGQHTSQDLTRSDAAIAARLMLNAEATPAQIGAFLIAHRIKRPTGAELAGFLDAYDGFAQSLPAIPDLPKSPWVFGVPYDGRSRTMPFLPVIALLLSAAGQPVILHGGDCMPTKYGLGLTDIWADLGLDFRPLSLSDCGQLLEATHFTFYYTPRHFPASQALTDYRDQIGKRPPLATLDLIWNPYGGPSRIVIGYVHPPTEKMIRGAFKLRGVTDFLLIKGLEGGTDLRLSQTTIVALPEIPPGGETPYLKINPHAYGVNQGDPVLDSRAAYQQLWQDFLSNPQADLPDRDQAALVWNGGFYLWQSGLCTDIKTGMAITEDYWRSGKIKAQWKLIQQELASFVR
jgi:anthranilate phosphoribosyltransferase